MWRTNQKLKVEIESRIMQNDDSRAMKKPFTKKKSSNYKKLE